MLLNHYDTLGVPHDANIEQIKKSFRKQAIKYHPDKHSGNPEFTQRFLQIKEAYDILIDESKRKEYDFEWHSYYGINRKTSDKFKSNNSSTSSTSATFSTNEKVKEEQEKNEKFRYDPHKAFYSIYDRELDETPQFSPISTPWETSVEGQIFFKLPKNIGKIIGGYSTYRQGHSKGSFFKYLAVCFRKSITPAIIFGVIMGVLYLIWTGNHVAAAGRNALVGFSIFYVISLLVIFSSNTNIYKFRNLNYYIGINGFAFFLSEGSASNVIQEFELNFKAITHLFTSEVEQYENFDYKGTDYSFTWLNIKSKKVLYQTKDSYWQKEGEPAKEVEPYYWMNRIAEKYWTVYLLDNIENELAKNGYLQFDIAVDDFTELIPYIKLEVGKVTFLNSNNMTYNLSDIKKVYRKKQNLYFEHVNYGKKFVFFESGNKDFIPLNLMGNKLFFIKALELFLGFKI